jgi:hypothetical protein
VTETTNFIWKDVNGGGGSSTSLTNLLPNTAYQFQVSSNMQRHYIGLQFFLCIYDTDTPVPCIVRMV